MVGKKRPTNTQATLLSGGNPQIPMGYGDQPIQAYLAAMPGWKRGVGEHLHQLTITAAPHVSKAIKWNSPFYGVAGIGWFMALHCLTNYVQVTFFNGTLLQPMPPIPSKHNNVRYLNLYEADKIDEALFTDWVKQASGLPGWLSSDIRIKK